MQSVDITKWIQRISHASLNERFIVVTAAILTFTLVVDMELSNVSDLLHSNIVSQSGVFTFLAIVGIYLSGQFLLLRFSGIATATVRYGRKDLHLIDLIVSAIQIFIIIMFLLIVAEITIGKSYDLFILVIVTVISNGLTTVIMFILFKRLIGYYKSHPERAILSYGLSGFIISITAIATLLFMVPILLTKPAFISDMTDVIFPTFLPGSTMDILNYAYYILSVISFLAVWISTVVLLSHYSQKIGKLKFWIAMTLPLVFYLGQIVVISFQIPFPFLDPGTATSLFYYRVVFTLSSTLGGLLFSQPFFLVSRTIKQDSNMHRHLIILGIGMVLFFVSGSAAVYHTPYPPFGLPTVALIGISSYLMFLGLYGSVISLSEDSELYKIIKTSAKEWKFFLKLSDAEVEKRILDKVSSIKQVMTSETGITPSVSIVDAKDYISEILNELEKPEGK